MPALSDSTDILSTTDEEERWREKKCAAEDLPGEYWSIQKLIRYIKSGNPTATSNCLCTLKSFDLKKQINQMAVQDVGGLEVLVNLIRSNDFNCRIGTLHVLTDLTENIDLRRYVIDLNIIQALYEIFSEPAVDLKTIGAAIIANITKVRLARKIVRECGLIPKILDLFDVKQETGKRADKEHEHREIQAAIAATKAIGSLLKSKRNQRVIFKSGLVVLLKKLLKIPTDDLLIPVLDICQQCASDINFQLSIITEDMLADFAKHMRSKTIEVQRQTCLTIFKCGSNTVIARTLKKLKAFKTLITIVSNEEKRKNVPLMFAATGAIWKTACIPENTEEFDHLKLYPILMELLQEEKDEDTLANILGAVSEMIRIEGNSKLMRTSKSIELVIKFLKFTHPLVLENVSKVLTEYCQIAENAVNLEQLDAVRLVWSLLKNKNSSVKINACWALRAYIENAPDSGEMVRSLVGGLCLLVELLMSEEITVLAAVCAVIAAAGKDQMNSAIMSDYKVIERLAHLVHTKDDSLREHLAAAVASCAVYGKNTQLLGKLKAVTPITNYMCSENPNVHRTTAMALDVLSSDPLNSITMHQNGVMPLLLECIGSKDLILQKAAARCVLNVRKLILDAEHKSFN